MMRRTASVMGALAIFVSGFEGTRQTAYQDMGGVWTICTGHTVGVHPGQHETIAECRTMLSNDLKAYGDGVDKCTRDKLNNNLYIVFTDAAYNLGVGRICKTFAPLINQGRTSEACHLLLRYNTVLGVPVPGLTRRRKAEYDLCMVSL